MLIFNIDDEPVLLDYSQEIIKKAASDAEVMSFRRASDALSAISKKNISPDVVFSDIEMPGISGLDFAVELKRLSPDSAVIFVTGHSEYAVLAYRIHAHGYILKPIDVGRVREELENISSYDEDNISKFQVKCFGNFGVFWKGEPLTFSRKQMRELFAFLIDRECRGCTAEEIISVLWEDESDIPAAKTRLRNLVFDLKNTFEKIGMGDILIRKSGFLSLRKDMIDCDYYRMLEGDMSAVNSYRGEYMTQYDWAEMTAGNLYFRNLKS